MPVSTTRPPLRAARMAQLVVCSLAAQSMAQSTPRPPVSAAISRAASTCARIERHVRAHDDGPSRAGAPPVPPPRCGRRPPPSGTRWSAGRSARRRTPPPFRQSGSRRTASSAAPPPAAHATVASSSEMLRGNRQQVGRRQVDQFAEETGMPRRAQEADVGADVVPAGAAGFAVVAVVRRLERRAVARRPSGDSGAALHHRPGWLVSQHHGVHGCGVANGAFRIGMQVGAADSHGGHAHLHLARSGIFDLVLARRNWRGAISSAVSMSKTHCKIPLDEAQFSRVRSRAGSVRPQVPGDAQMAADGHLDPRTPIPWT